MPRPKGGDHITHYVVEDRADHALNGTSKHRKMPLLGRKGRGIRLM
jgi:hypothetical protein